MEIIGLLGGVASGKSLVAQHLSMLGAGILDADRAAHEVLRMPHIEARLRERWNGAVLGADGHIDRAQVARVVFSSTPEGTRERKFLEELTHPEIGQLLWKQAEVFAASGVPVAVLDAPLLLEAGWDKYCDVLVFVDAPQKARETRAMARGLSAADFAARESVQHSLDEKRARADVIVDNSGSAQQTRAQVEQLWRSLPGQSPSTAGVPRC